jgi:hypothetical protein
MIWRWIKSKLRIGRLTPIEQATGLFDAFQIVYRLCMSCTAEEVETARQLARVLKYLKIEHRRLGDKYIFL